MLQHLEKGEIEMKTIITRKSLEEMVINTLNKGATMEEIHRLIEKLNVQVREGQNENNRLFN